MSITAVNTALNAQVNRSISLTYLQSILFCAGLYLMFFMGVFLSSALLGVINLMEYIKLEPLMEPRAMQNIVTLTVITKLPLRT